MKTLKSENYPLKIIAFCDPNDNYYYNAKYSNIEELIMHVRERRKIKGYHRLEDEIIYLFLAQIEENQEATVEVLNHKLSHMFVGAGVFVNILKDRFNGEKVKPSLAILRGTRCIGCDFNDTKSKPKWFMSVGAIILGFMLGHKSATMITEYLGWCTKCGCNLKEKVFVTKQSVLNSLDENTRRQLPDGVKMKSGETVTCWQLFKDND